MRVNRNRVMWICLWGIGISFLLCHSPSVAAVSEAEPIVEELSDILQDEPNHHFSLAIEAFMKQDHALAAEEIRKGAAYLKLETLRAEDKGKEALDRSITELEGLADSLSRGEPHTLQDLTQAFGRTQQALAHHHYLKAMVLWTEQKLQLAGKELKKSVAHLERGITYVGREFLEESQDILAKTRDLAKNLWEKATVGKEETEMHMKRYEEHLLKLHERLKNPTMK
jgi:hypothetical protein